MLSKIRNSEVFKDGKFVQVLILSASFMLIFTAFMTTCIIEQTVLESVKKEDASFTGDGYTSLAIIYAVFAVVAWVSPSVVAILHAKKALFISALFYLFFIVGFLLPRDWILYLTSATIGAAAAILWTAQGNFLSLTSTPQTISRNSGVFWGINQCSLFFGNLFVFWQFHGKTVIDEDTRRVVFVVLSVVCLLGSLCFLFLKDLRSEETEVDSDEDDEVKGKSTGKRSNRRNPEVGGFMTAWLALKEAMKLSVTPHMLLLSITSLYTGLEQCFYSGVYSTSIGFTEAFGEDAKKLVGLVGILIGVGEVTGGALFGLLGPVTTKKGQTPIIALGLVTHATCFVLVYLNLPNGSPLGATKDVSYFTEPYVSVAIFCAFLLGFGDACFQTQLISMFASGYAEKSSAAFAIFKFIQSAGSAGAFFASSYMGLYTQLVILACSCALGALSFSVVEWRIKKQKAKRESKASGDGNTSDSEGNPDASLTMVDEKDGKSADKEAKD